MENHTLCNISNTNANKLAINFSLLHNKLEKSNSK